jgi:hypothetical protein
MLLFPSVTVFYLTIVVFGLSVPLKNMIAYTHLMEFLPGRVTDASGVLFFLDGMVLVVSPLVLMYITINTDVFLWAGLIMNLIGILGFFVMYIPESTIFLLEKDRFDIAKKDIEYLLNFNKASQEARLATLSLLQRLEVKKKSHLEIALKQQRDHQAKNQPSMMSKIM